MDTEILHAEEVYQDKVTFLDRVSDNLANFCGSWTFILSFCIIMIGWMVTNGISLISVDPFPFMFLNLALSCVAAIQAPIILMASNRSNKKEAIKADIRFHTDTKMEEEVRDLHSKVDSLITIVQNSIAK